MMGLLVNFMVVKEWFSKVILLFLIKYGIRRKVESLWGFGVGIRGNGYWLCWCKDKCWIFFLIDGRDWRCNVW